MQCPECKQVMDRQTIEKVEIDRCPACSGIWLDKGELNKLADSKDRMAEFNAIDHDSGIHGDRHPKRNCPVCQQTMKKVDLDKNSDVIFDYCTKCHGFWLDKGELAATKAYLTRLKGSDEDFNDHFFLVSCFSRMGDVLESP